MREDRPASNSDLGCATLILAVLLMWICFSISQVAVGVSNVAIQLERIEGHFAKPTAPAAPPPSPPPP
jgi:hypothetical protein